MSRLRNVCFTINNPHDELNPNRFNLPIIGINYLVYQLEAGNQGTRHIQGYVEFDNSRSISAIKSTLGEMHIEKRQGTAKQASDYCKKREGSIAGPFEFGTLSNQGKRTDYEHIRDRFIKGDTIRDIAFDHPGQFAKNSRGLRELQTIFQPPINLHTLKQVCVLWGSPGTGKSSFWSRLSSIMNLTTYAKDPDTVWWDGYSNHSTIMLDEFPGSMSAKDAVKVLGEFNYPKQTKGGSILTDRIERIWITSNTNPLDWFPQASEVSKFAVHRLITKIYHISQWVDCLEPLNFLSPFTPLWPPIWHVCPNEET